MAYSLDDKFVVGISSSALFDTSVAADIFDKQGLKPFIAHQIANEEVPFQRGTGFPLIEALLHLNRLANKRLSEVMILSHNHPAAGLRAMNSVDEYKLGISRAAFVGRTAVSKYLIPYKVGLFLSTNEVDVREATEKGVPSALVWKPPHAFDVVPDELRIAFDGDAVIFSEESQRIYDERGINAFYEHEKAQAKNPMHEGPFASFLRWLAHVQEDESVRNDNGSVPIRTAIVTSRNCPAHKRVILTLRAWGVSVDELFFLGGIAKDRILQAFQPHIFFDDQKSHVELAAEHVPSAQVLSGAPSRSPQPIVPDVPETSLSVAAGGDGAEKSGLNEEVHRLMKVSCSKRDFESRCRYVFSRYTPLGGKSGVLDRRYREFITMNIAKPAAERARIVLELERYDLSFLTTHDPLLNRESMGFVEEKLQRILSRAMNGKQTELDI